MTIRDATHMLKANRTVYNIGWYEATTDNLALEPLLLRRFGPANNWRETKVPKNYDRAYEIQPGREIYVSDSKSKIIVKVTDKGCDALSVDYDMAGVGDWGEFLGEMTMLGLKVRRFDVQIDDNLGLIPFDELYELDQQDLLGTYIVSDFSDVSSKKTTLGKTITFGSFTDSDDSESKRAARAGIRMYRWNSNMTTRIELELRGKSAQRAVDLFVENGANAIPGLIRSKIRFLDQSATGRARYRAQNAEWFDQLIGDVPILGLGLYKGKRALDEFEQGAKYIFKIRKVLRKLALHPNYGEKYLLQVARDPYVSLEPSTVRHLHDIREAYGIPTDRKTPMTTVRKLL